VALHSAGQRGAARAVLDQALQRLPYDPELLSGAAAFEREAGHTDLANRYLQRYAAVAPDGIQTN
jgi:Tfp pilus assembly protein PilF